MKILLFLLLICLIIHVAFSILHKIERQSPIVTISALHRALRDTLQLPSSYIELLKNENVRKTQQWPQPTIYWDIPNTLVQYLLQDNNDHHHGDRCIQIHSIEAGDVLNELRFIIIPTKKQSGAHRSINVEPFSHNIRLISMDIEPVTSSSQRVHWLLTHLNNYHSPSKNLWRYFLCWSFCLTEVDKLEIRYNPQALVETLGHYDMSRPFDNKRLSPNNNAFELMKTTLVPDSWIVIDPYVVLTYFLKLDGASKIKNGIWLGTVQWKMDPERDSLAILFQQQGSSNNAGALRNFQNDDMTTTTSLCCQRCQQSEAIFQLIDNTLSITKHKSIMLSYNPKTRKNIFKRFFNKIFSRSCPSLTQTLYKTLLEDFNKFLKLRSTRPKELVFLNYMDATARSLDPKHRQPFKTDVIFPVHSIVFESNKIFIVFIKYLDKKRQLSFRGLRLLITNKNYALPASLHLNKILRYSGCLSIKVPTNSAKKNHFTAMFVQCKKNNQRQN